jgi:hypothetical protein
VGAVVVGAVAVCWPGVARRGFMGDRGRERIFYRIVIFGRIYGYYIKFIGIIR